MLCEVNMWGNFATTWIGLTVIGLAGMIVMSGIVFYKYYVKATYETWLWKTNPKYPTPEMVREEIMQMLKGLATGVLCPAMSLWLSEHGLSEAYCGWGGYGVGYHIFQFVFILVVTDFFEFRYHRWGHMSKVGWEHHKHHHVFYNPSPFSVIADEYVDQFVRSLPLVVYPMIMPINMDLLFFTFAVFFYAYGVVLHWGHELNWPDAHHPIINSSYQHYLHHSTSIKGKPYFTGFYVKIWDYMYGSTYPYECKCVKCQREKGLRTREAWEKVEKVDYSPLLRPSFWFSERTTKVI